MNPFSLRLPAGFADAEANARRVLLAERNERGHWTGELSTSALSTATSIVALGCVDEVAHREPVRRAVTWLTRHQNEDGGWGDTTRSFSNISTTLLCWSALCRFGGDAESTKEARRKASHWIRDYCGSLAPALLAETVKARYGKDRTFSVPILMLCAICGRLGPERPAWRRVMALNSRAHSYSRRRLQSFSRSWITRAPPSAAASRISRSVLPSEKASQVTG